MLVAILLYGLVSLAAGFGLGYVAGRAHGRRNGGAGRGDNGERARKVAGILSV